MILMNNINSLNRRVIQGDCIKVMKSIQENSVDSIITDPPYQVRPWIHG